MFFYHDVVYTTLKGKHHANRLILVTGATGKTGGAVAHQLLERGYFLRATVRTMDDRADALKALGAHVADFHELSSMRRAMEGVERVSLVYPPRGERRIEATMNGPTRPGFRNSCSTQ